MSQNYAAARSTRPSQQDLSHNAAESRSRSSGRLAATACPKGPQTRLRMFLIPRKRPLHRHPPVRMRPEEIRRPEYEHKPPCMIMTRRRCWLMSHCLPFCLSRHLALAAIMPNGEELIRIGPLRRTRMFLWHLQVCQALQASLRHRPSPGKHCIMKLHRCAPY